MERNLTSGGDSYEGWVGSSDTVDNMWETKNGESFVITNEGVYLPQGIGSRNGEQKVPYHQIKDCDVDIEFDSSINKISIVSGIGFLALILGVIIGPPLGVISMVAGIIILGLAGVMIVKEKKAKTGVTTIYIETHRFKTDVSIEGAVKEEIIEGFRKHSTKLSRMISDADDNDSTSE